MAPREALGSILSTLDEACAGSPRRQTHRFHCQGHRRPISLMENLQPRDDCLDHTCNVVEPEP
jgi:hypothetical protein